MHILIAPNAFKNSLDADEAARAIQQGFLQSNLPCECELFPIGDGGDGTGELLVKQCGGQVVEAETHDPLGRKRKASFGLIEEGRTAVIEMANASGLRLLKREELNPMVATSYGTGEQIKTALDRGVKKIIVGMGGSATVDGACGMLKALGIRFLNVRKEDLTEMPGSLAELDAIDLTGLDERVLDCEVVVLCDVANRLLGEEGAAAIFGPQKGASPVMVKKLDAALERLSEVVFRQTGKDMAAIKSGGTAGGAAAGLYALINAKLVNGIDHFLELTNFDSALAKADLVVTGEGSIDEQTLQGKGPFGVAYRAKQKGLPVIGLAGKVPLEPGKELQHYFDALLAIGQQPGDLPAALATTAANLTRTAIALGNLLALQNKNKPTAANGKTIAAHDY